MPVPNCLNHMKRSSDPFERTRSYAQCIRDQISAEWAHCEDQVEYCLARGDIDQAEFCRRQYIERIEMLEQELRDTILAMPPFLTLEGMVYHRHPLTPENEHILREAMRA